MNPGKPAKPYTHSTFAKKIVSDLAIAHYQKPNGLSSTVCRVREDLCKEVSPSTKTIVFENISGEPVASWKSYYDGFDYYAKHFLIRSLEGHKSVFRHYTICNAMRPGVYQGYINALKPESDESYAPFERSLLDSQDKSQMTVCIKNYGNPRGLSTKIHAQPQGEQRFEVKGPMGHGLKPKQSGIHVAFAAGTGCLCFVDVAASIAQYVLNIRARNSSINNRSKNMSLLSSSDDIDMDNF